MKLYRAVPKENLDYLTVYYRSRTARLPGNVPYFVDNIWEFCRTYDKPSRRYGVYASPTVELALENASAQHLNKDQYITCEVAPLNPVNAYQLSVTDARHHPDIRNLQKLVHDYIYDMKKPSLGDKQFMSALFVPGLTRQELENEILHNTELQNFMHKAVKIVSVWTDEAIPNGELFFELEENNSYLLI